MEAVFLKIINMSINASWLILFVCLLRPLLKNAPKTINCLLWAFVGLRLICPFSIKSVLSLIPSADTLPQDITQTDNPVIHSGIPVIDNPINEVISENLAPVIENSINPMQVLAFIAQAVWLAGIVALLLYGIISYVRLKLKVREYVTIKDNIRICDSISTPFILGLIKPKIYLPSGIDEEKAKHVIAHEKAHLRRGDHLWKPLGFALLCVYWFNPVIWIAYILLCRDIELACDEIVIKDFSSDEKITYSEALLSCAVSRRTVMVCPLAFGEIGVKNRIKSVLNYRKPAFWVLILSVLLCISAAVFFLTDPLSNGDPSIKVKTNYSIGNEKITVNELENKYGFDIYYNNIESVTVYVDGKWLDFKDALINDIITPSDLLNIAYNDYEKGYCEFGVLSDGGSTTYWYPSFTIHKKDSILIDESKDLIISAVSTAKNKANIFAVLAKQECTQRITGDDFKNKHGFDVYFIDIESIEIKLSGEYCDLKTSLTNNTESVEALLELADEDAEKGSCRKALLDDGGSVFYIYDTFEIKKYDSLDGNKNLIISAVNRRGTGTTGNLPVIYSYSDAEDFSSIPHNGETVNMCLNNWSWGFSNKTVTGGIAAIITEKLNSMKESGKTSPKISSNKFDQLSSSPAERGTLWLEVQGKLYRINPDRDEICRVDSHYGKGNILIADEEFFDIINSAWYYSGSNYYYGKLVNEVMIVFHEYKETCDVDMTVTSITLTENGENDSVTVSLVAKKDMETYVGLHSQYSDDNLLDNTASNTVSLKANTPQDVTIKFRGDNRGRPFYVTLLCGGTSTVLYF